PVNKPNPCPVPPASEYTSSFRADDNYPDGGGLDQISIFLAGKLFDNVGAFIQMTYDPNAHVWGWDNTDIRYARTGTLFGKSATYGLSLNNNPTIQDPWATTPAWGYPAFDSAVMPQFGFPATLLQGTLAQQVLGLTAYANFDNGLYAEFGGYKGLSQDMLAGLGAGGSGFNVNGIAPYLRVAHTQDVGGGTLMVGGLAMLANLEPNYTGTYGKDRYFDLMLDSQYDYQGSNYGLTFKARDIMEWQHLASSKAQANSSNLSDRLNALDLSVTYYKPKWALIGAYSNVTGTSDAGLYGANSTANSPDSSSISIEVNYSPWMDGSPFSYKDMNFKFGAKYTHFLKLYGGTSNFDGNRHNASDNDYVFLYTLFAF
ncbi:hypothetical protein, partial [Allgaiera indica]